MSCGPGDRCVLGVVLFFFFQAEDGIRDLTVTGVQTCALPICSSMTFHFEIYREAEEAALATAELVYVNADPSSMRAVPLPEELRERVRRYERTAPQA